MLFLLERICVSFTMIRSRYHYQGPFILSVSDWFGASASTLMSYLISWVATLSWSDWLGVLRNLSNI